MSCIERNLRIFGLLTDVLIDYLYVQNRYRQQSYIRHFTISPAFVTYH